MMTMTTTMMKMMMTMTMMMMMTMVMTTTMMTMTMMTITMTTKKNSFASWRNVKEQICLMTENWSPISMEKMQLGGQPKFS